MKWERTVFTLFLILIPAIIAMWGLMGMLVVIIWRCISNGSCPP